MAEHRILTPGVYSLTNVKSGSVLDLSGGNNKDLIGFPAHDGNNQKWKFSQLGSGYCIQSISCHDRFMMVESGLHSGSLVVGTRFAVSWVVTPDDAQPDAWRIMWPHSNLCFDLEGHGSDVPGAKVLLSELNPQESSQLWHFRVTTCDQHELPAELHLPSASQQPPVQRASQGGAGSDNEGDIKIVTTEVTTTTTTRIKRADPSFTGAHEGSMLTLRQYAAQHSWVALPVALLSLFLSLQKK